MNLYKGGIRLKGMNSATSFYNRINSIKPKSPVEDRFNITLSLFKETGGKLLDIGCYDGEKTMRIAKVTNAEPHGTDILEDQLALAKKRGVNASFMDCNAQAPFPFADEAFDAMYCGDVIEHIYSPDWLLKEMKRLLKKDGYIVITTPNLSSWKNRIALLLGWQPFFTEVSTEWKVGNPRVSGLPSGHIRVFTWRALKELVGRYGFIIEEAKVLPPEKPRTLLGKIGYLLTLPLHSRVSLADEVVIRLRKE